MASYQETLMLRGSSSKPTIAIITARYLRENPYQILALQEAFQTHNIETIPILIGPHLNGFGYPQEMMQDSIFQQSGAVWVNRIRDYLRNIRGVDAVITGCWKDNKWLIHAAKAMGKFVVEADYFSAFDAWSFGSHALLLKGEFQRRISQWAYGKRYQDMEILSIGSIAHEYPSVTPPLPDRETFFRHYELDLSKKLAVFFPSWYPDPETPEYEEWGAWYLERRVAICESVRDAGLNLLVKLHPAIYAEWHRSEGELKRRLPWLKILEPEDTFATYKYMDVGLGILTSTGMDVNYWNRPFIYVDSDIAPFLEQHRKRVARWHCDLPVGASVHWDSGEGGIPAYPLMSWVGLYCQVDELKECLRKEQYEQVKPEHYQQFNAEFWHQADGQSAKRIADYVVNKLAEHQSKVRLRRLAYVIREAWRDGKF